MGRRDPHIFTMTFAFTDIMADGARINLVDAGIFRFIIPVRIGYESL